MPTSQIALISTSQLSHPPLPAATSPETPTQLGPPSPLPPKLAWVPWAVHGAWISYTSPAVASDSLARYSPDPAVGDAVFQHLLFSPPLSSTSSHSHAPYLPSSQLPPKLPSIPSFFLSPIKPPKIASCHYPLAVFDRCLLSCLSYSLTMPSSSCLVAAGGSLRHLTHQSA